MLFTQLLFAVSACAGKEAGVGQGDDLDFSYGMVHQQFSLEALIQKNHYSFLVFSKWHIG